MIVAILARLKRFVARLVPSGDLATRTIKSGAWEFAINVGTRSLQLIVMIVLANLLSPRDFGLMGIALLVLAGLNRFSRLGINQALIQHQDEDVDQYLDTAFGLQVAKGVVVAGIAFLSAPLVASLFGEPRVTPLLQFIALSPMAHAVRNPGVIYFEKDLQFHRKFVYRVSGSLVEFVISLSWALVYQNVWALAVGFVAATVVRSFVSYWIHPYRPRLGLDRAKALELFNYGKWITASNVVYYLLDEGDDAVVGGLLGATALGFYKLAYRVGNAPATEITKVIGDVMFASFSKLQDDRESLQRAFMRTVRMTTVASFPIAVGIVAVAPVFVLGFMGREWLPMVRAMQLLCIYGLLVSFTTAFHQLWKALGKPDYVTKLGLLRLAVLAVLILPAAEYGIEGVAALIALVHLVVTMPLDVYLLHRFAEIDPRRLGTELVYPLVASLAMGWVVLTARSMLDLAPKLEFLVLVVLGVVTYVPAVLAIDTTVEWGITRNVSTIVDALTG